MVREDVDKWGYPEGGLTSVQRPRIVDDLTVERFRSDLADEDDKIMTPSKHAGMLRLDAHTYPNLPRNIRFVVIDYGTPWPYWSWYDDDTGEQVLLVNGNWLAKKASEVIEAGETDDV